MEQGCVSVPVKGSFVVNGAVQPGGPAGRVSVPVKGSFVVNLICAGTRATDPYEFQSP